MDEKIKDKKTFKEKIKAVNKKKLAAIIVLIIFGLSIAGGGIAIGIILSNKEPDTPVSFTYSEFYYGIRGGDTTGIQLKTDFMNGVKLSDFNVTKSNNNIDISNNMVLTSGKINENAQIEIDFFYNDSLVARFKISVLKGAIYIKSPSDLKNIDTGTAKYFIQTSNILINDSLKLKDFKEATYFGNYFNITALNIKEGGLFTKTVDAMIFSVKLIDVTGSITLGNNSYFGAIASYAEKTSFYGCGAQGSISVMLSGNSLITAHIGGLFGYLKSINRYYESQDPVVEERDNIYDYTDMLISAAVYCTSDLEITVTGNGSPYIGGIAGTAYNPSFRNCINNGKIDVTLNSSTTAYIGGIAGRLYKFYEQYGYTVRSFDYSLALINFGQINVNILGQNESGAAYVGGIFSELTNHNFYNSKSLGEININSDGAVIFAGGLIAKAKNELNSSSFDMFIQNCIASSTMNIKTEGNAAVAKLTCETLNVKYINNDYSGQILEIDINNQKILTTGEEYALGN